MVKDGWNLQGNARFEGFCIDLLARVAARAGFHYRLRLVPDNMYGAWDPETGQWNGIVKELMDRVNTFSWFFGFLFRRYKNGLLLGPGNETINFFISLTGN